MNVGGVIVMVAVGVILAALYYGINIFDIFLVGAPLFTFLAVTIGLIVVVVARRRNSLSGGRRSNLRKKQRRDSPDGHRGDFGSRRATEESRQRRNPPLK
jgi:hypothetical protein